MKYEFLKKKKKLCLNNYEFNFFKKQYILNVFRI